jgi:hypothetical protein
MLARVNVLCGSSNQHYIPLLKPSGLAQPAGPPN